MISADLLHLKEIEQISAGVVSIGGADVFDGIAIAAYLLYFLLK